MPVPEAEAGPESTVALFADRLATAVVVTSSGLAAPGPIIRYVNPSFLRLTGYERHEILGRSPRMLQGRRTRTEVMRDALAGRGSCHTVVTNYRKNGEPYLCEIDIRPIRDADGNVQAFVAFEREVVRRRGRPRAGLGGRFGVLDERTADELPGVFHWSLR